MDNLLSLDIDGVSSVHEWVEKHKNHIATAVLLANKNLNFKAAQRKARHDVKVNVEKVVLKVGSNVLLRLRVQGRNKIQDRWGAVPFVVVERIKDSSPYKVVTIDGSGRVKTVNRY